MVRPVKGRHGYRRVAWEYRCGQDSGNSNPPLVTVCQALDHRTRILLETDNFAHCRV